MKRDFLFLCCIVFSCSGLQLQAQSLVVRGLVRDAETQLPVGFSSISVPGAGSGTTADARGLFTLTLQRFTAQKIVVSNVGYNTDTVQITSAGNNLVINLKPLAGTLNNVVITGVSRATLLKENPVAIQTVSQQAIEHSPESNVIDVLVKNVPGMNAVKTGPNISKPFIRGLGYNRVLTLYDGIRQEGQQWGDEHGIEVDAYNIDRAEVIKGPASIMYGSDALAGVVSLIPAAAVREKKLHGKYISEYQSNNGLTGNGLRLGYSNGRWTYIARGSYRLAKNYTNPVDGRVYNTGFQEINASAGIRHAGEKGYTTLDCTLYDNLQGIPDGSRDSATRMFTKQTQEAGADDLKNRPVVSPAELDAYRLSPLHQHIEHYRVYGSRHWQAASGGDLDLSLAYQRNVRREYSHPTLPRQAAMYVQLHTVNYGLRYNAPAFLNTELSFGINGMYQQNKSREATDFPIPDYRLLDAGAYVFAKWKNNRLTLSGGLRYDRRYLQGNDFYTLTDAATGFTGKVPSGTAGAVNQFPAFDKLFSGTSLSIGAALQVSGSLSLKANIARGYRAPGITEFASNGLDPGAHIIYLGNRGFKPEFSLQEDAGADVHTKNVSLSASLFCNNIQQYIYLSQVTDASGNAVADAQGNKTYQYQQASAQLYGMEASFNLHPAGAKGFLFSNSLAAVYGYNRRAQYKHRGVNGAYLPLIPPVKILSSISETIQVKPGLFSDITAKAEAEYNAAQNRYLALENTETASPAYALFHISLGTKINYTSTRSIELLFQVSNVFNKAYQSGLSRLKYLEYYTRPAGAASGIYNMGRNICLKAIVPF